MINHWISTVTFCFGYVPYVVTCESYLAPTEPWNLFTFWALSISIASVIEGGQNVTSKSIPKRFFPRLKKLPAAWR